MISTQEQKQTDLEFLYWVEDQQKELFRFFYENSPYFPNHCTDVAYVLGMYYENVTQKSAVISRLFKRHYVRKQWHRVLRIGEHYIDFSLFQFYAAKSRFKKLSFEEAYDFAINELQGGRVVFDASYATRFTDDISVESVSDYHLLYKQEYTVSNESDWNKYSEEIIQSALLDTAI